VNILGFVWIHVRRSPWRVVVMVGLFAIAIVVFAVVSELSRVSEAGLNAGIAKDSGELGTYEVSFDGRLYLDIERQRKVSDVIAASASGSVTYFFVDLPPVHSECAPYNVLGEVSFRLLRDESGDYASLPFGSVGDIDTRWCLDGVEISATAFYLPDDDAKATLGSRMYIAPEYAGIVRLSTVGAVSSGFTVHTGSDSSREVIERIARYMVQEDALKLGLDPGELVSVGRVDQDAEAVRAAAEGMSITYDVIRWSVLALAVAALTLVQTVTVNQRAWFFGLSRALGAPSRIIVAYVAAETAGIVVGAMAVASGLLTALSPSITDFARAAFGVQADVMHAQTMLTLALAVTVAVVFATSIPVIAVLRRDPLEVLEAPRG